MINASTTLNRLPSILVQTVHQDSPRLATSNRTAFLHVVLAFDCSIDGARESHSEIDPNSLIDGVVESFGVGGEVEIGEETKRSKSEGNDRRNDVLEKPRSIQNGPISSKLQNPRL